MTDEHHQNYSGANLHGGASSSPYPVARLSAPISLVDKAKLIESANATIAAITNAKLEVIARQMQALQTEAKLLLEKAAADLRLHAAQCRFRPLVGHAYHLYGTSNCKLFFSMLSPEERAAHEGSEYHGCYQLQADQSWTRLDRGASDGSVPAVELGA